MSRFNWSEKEKWVVKWLLKGQHIDMLNSDFVDAFIEDFNAKVHIMMYGANKCRELSSLLSQMYQDNKLYREAVGLNEMCSGFPKWIYTYRLRESNCRDIIAELNERL